MEVRSIPYEQAVPWFLEKHYAKRIPGSVMFAFGLYENEQLTGVISYGMSPNSKMNEIGGKRVLELNRLVLSKNKKNDASYFIAQTYKHLKEYVLLSYADDLQGHKGYIYQACNWIYTGTTKGGEVYETDTGLVHKRAYDQRKFKGKVLSSKKGEKHRYFYVPGKEKNVVEQLLKRFPRQEYPKGNNVNYDSGKELATQSVLF